MHIDNFEINGYRTTKHKTIEHSSRDSEVQYSNQISQKLNADRRNDSFNLITISGIWEALHIKNYTQKLIDNDIGVEDFFMLTEKDLLNMRFSIGAKNRVIQFQQTFKHSDPRIIKNNLFWK